MILIADSGSTKTDWCLSDEGEEFYFQTIGLNPYFLDKQSSLESIRMNFPSQKERETVSTIYFYGSGCGREKSQNCIKELLSCVFPQASISVESDLIGAAIACFGKNKGIVAILGTGMNIGFWNGSSIKTPIPSLGYILGDAGSGAVMGRKLISAIFENRLSQNIRQNFFTLYRTNSDEVLDKVYKQPRANAYLASFVPFIVKHKDDTEIRIIIKETFSDFAKYYAQPISNLYAVDTIHIVGSIAIVFEDILKQCLEEEALHLGSIIKKPLEAMKRHICHL